MDTVSPSSGEDIAHSSSFRPEKWLVSRNTPLRKLEASYERGPRSLTAPGPARSSTGNRAGPRRGPPSCIRLTTSASVAYRPILRASSPPPTSRAPAPSPRSETTPEEIPPVGGSLGGGGGAALGGGGGAAGGGGGAAGGGGGAGGAAALGGGGGAGGGFGGGHSALALAPPACASGHGSVLAQTSSLTLAEALPFSTLASGPSSIPACCAMAEVATTIAATTAPTTENKMTRLNTVPPFLPATPGGLFLYVTNISNLVALRNTFLDKNRNIWIFFVISALYVVY